MSVSTKVRITIINTKNTVENIDWLFKTIKDVNLNSIDYNENLSELISKYQNEIFVFNLNYISPELFELLKVISGNETLNIENIFISLSNELSKGLTVLSRLGFTKIYYFPEEEFVLRNDVIERVEQLKAQMESAFNRENFYKRFSFENLVGKSPKFIDCIEIAKKVAKKSESTVLLLGRLEQVRNY